MDDIIWLIIMIPVSLLFTGIGIYAWRCKKPMWFWSGSTVKESEISDISAYNRADSSTRTEPPHESGNDTRGGPGSGKNHQCLLIKEPVQVLNSFVELLGTNAIVVHGVQLAVGHLYISGTFFSKDGITFYDESIAQFVTHEMP